MRVLRISTILALVSLMTTGLFAQTKHHTAKLAAVKLVAKHQQDKPTKSKMDDKMMAMCHEMMGKHEQMHADMKAMDAKLDAMVSKMNAATGVERVDALAEVVTEMASQRREMAMKMSAMQSEMMGHMMEHMKMGKKSMMSCPMMKGM